MRSPRLPLPLEKLGKLEKFFSVTEKSGNFKILPESQRKLNQKVIKLCFIESLKKIVSRHNFVEHEFHISKTSIFIITERWGKWGHNGLMHFSIFIQGSYSFS